MVNSNDISRGTCGQYSQHPVDGPGPDEFFYVPALVRNLPPYIFPSTQSSRYSIWMSVCDVLTFRLCHPGNPNQLWPSYAIVSCAARTCMNCLSAINELWKSLIFGVDPSIMPSILNAVLSLIILVSKEERQNGPKKTWKAIQTQTCLKKSILAMIKTQFFGNISLNAHTSDMQSDISRRLGQKFTSKGARNKKSLNPTCSHPAFTLGTSPQESQASMGMELLFRSK